MRSSVQLLTLSLLLGCGTVFGTTAYTIGATQTGNQSFTGTLGMDFDVNSPIFINSLGVFDSSSNGITGTLFVGIYNRTTQALVIPYISFTGTGIAGDFYVGATLFRNITPVALLPGQYTVASYGYSASDLNGNVNCVGTNGGVCSGITNPGYVASTMDTGGGLVSYVGLGRFTVTPGAFPSTAQGVGAPNSFHAGDFQFTPTPEPGTLSLLAVAAGLLGFWRRKKPTLS